MVRSHPSLLSLTPCSSPGSGSASSRCWPSSTSATTSSWSPSEGSVGSSSTESSTHVQSLKWVLQSLDTKNQKLTFVPNFLSGVSGVSNYGLKQAWLISAGTAGHRLGFDHSQYELWRLETLLSHHQVVIGSLFGQTEHLRECVLASYILKSLFHDTACIWDISKTWLMKRAAHMGPTLQWLQRKQTSS